MEQSRVWDVLYLVRLPLLICIALTCFLGTRTAHGSIARKAFDYEVACLDVESGRELWRSKPGPLGSPELEVVSPGVLEIRGESDDKRTTAYYLKVKSGKLLSTKPRRARRGTVGLAAIGNLRDSRGRRFIFESGNTRHLEVASSRGVEVVKELESFPENLSIAGSVAIFNFGQGGEVYAYDFIRDRLLWEFDVQEHFAYLADDLESQISVVQDAVYVSIGDVVVALSLRTGRQKWHTHLPSGATWHYAGLVGRKLLVAGYGKLYALDRRSGKLLWSFRTGLYTPRWPLIVDGRAFVAVRPEMPRRKNIIMPVSAREFTPSALKIERIGNRFTVEPIARASIPSGQQIWWSLRPPPVAGHTRKKIELDLAEVLDEEKEEQILLDLTSLLQGSNAVAYVKFSWMYNTAELRVGRELVAKKEW